MAGAYAGFVNSAVGTRLATQLGLPRPVRLRRYAADAPLIEGPVLVGGLTDAPVAVRARDLLAGEGVDVVDAVPDGEKIGAAVLDLTAVQDPADLDVVRVVLAPALKALRPSGRVIIVGTDPSSATSVAQAAARRSLEGITRSIGKELRAGATANLVLVADGAVANADAAVRFLLSGRSAYVDGQVIRVGAGTPTEPADRAAPLTGKVAVVTGAARGIGAAIAEVLARDGARVVCVDIPAAGESLARTANRVGGTALQVDVTAPDAGRRILDHANERHGGLDIVVHNAGITRDKLLANMDAGALGVGARRQPRFDPAHERGAARCRRGPRRRSRRAGVLDRRDRGQPRPDQLRRLQGRRHRAGRRALGGRGPAPRGPSPSTPWRRGSSRPR